MSKRTLRPSTPLSRRLPLLALFLVLLPGCGGMAGAEGDSPRRSANVISAEELAEVGTGDLWQAVQRLRAPWLRSRGAMGTPVVFLNGQRYGEIQLLQSIPVGDVESARFVSAGDATTLHGTGYPAGIIDVRTRRR